MKARILHQLRCKRISKLGLGTVQFGQAYGVSNTRGQVPAREVKQILERARQVGIGLLDTAANYGAAETVLAGLDTQGFRIVTKTIALKNGLDAVIARAQQSARNLNADTLLVHHASDLRGPEGESYWKALQDLREQGLFRKLGISAYIGDDPLALATRFRPDVMQLPVSVLDQRLLANGTLSRLVDLKVEIHARSVFLQGLMFLETLPAKLQGAAPHFRALRKRLHKAGLTPLSAALGFVLSRPEISFGLVGVTSLVNLNEIAFECDKPLPDINWSSLALKDEVALTPMLW
ncbi:MAG TPA: aldo/keto reductase [Rhizomicrobium sp.]|nr:aldo/keto reductase [Rhizomicrobium sp.]